jgi:hypothetical protein
MSQTGGLSLPRERGANLYQIRCEDCPESAVAKYTHARKLGLRHSYLERHQVIVEVFEQ